MGAPGRSNPPPPPKVTTAAAYRPTMPRDIGAAAPRGAFGAPRDESDATLRVATEDSPAPKAIPPPPPVPTSASAKARAPAAARNLAPAPPPPVARPAPAPPVAARPVAAATSTPTRDIGKNEVVRSLPPAAGAEFRSLADMLEPMSIPPPRKAEVPRVEPEAPADDPGPGEETMLLPRAQARKLPRWIAWVAVSAAGMAAAAWVVSVLSVDSSENAPTVVRRRTEPTVAAAQPSSPAVPVAALAPPAGATKAPAAPPPTPAAPREEQPPARPEPVDPPAAQAPPAPTPAAHAPADPRADAALLKIGPPPEGLEAMSSTRRKERAEELMDRSDSFSRRGDHARAEALLRQAYHLNPDDSSIAIRLAASLEEQARHDEALAWSRHAVEMAPNIAAPYYGLGRILEQQGRVQEAIANYREALERNPNEPRAQRRLRYLGQ